MVDLLLVLGVAYIVATAATDLLDVVIWRIRWLLWGQRPPDDDPPAPGPPNPGTT